MTRHAALLIGVIAVIGLASGCGSSSTKTTAATTTTAAGGSSGTTAGGASGTRSKLTQCLESNGVPASVAGNLFHRPSGSNAPGSAPSGSTPSGSFPSGGFTRTTIPSQYQSAFQTCIKQYGGFGGGGAGFGNSTAFKTYENCLEANGVTIPTTTPTTATSGTTGGFGGGGGFASLQQLRSQPAFAAAQTKCASLLPARAGAGSSTTSTVPAAA